MEHTEKLTRYTANFVDELTKKRINRCCYFTGITINTTSINVYGAPFDKRMGNY